MVHAEETAGSYSQVLPAGSRKFALACFAIGRTMNDIVHKSPRGAMLDELIEPDAHGQAALLLAEAILHALVETGALTLEGALSVIQTTCEVKIEVAEQSGESDKRMKESLRLLRSISDTFSAYPHQPD